MRISDWSSDVCSSDLNPRHLFDERMCREPELFTTKHPLLRCGSVCRLIFEPCLQCFLGDTASSADVPSACRVDKETLEVLLNKPMTTARSSPRCDAKLDEPKSRSEEHTSELQSL